MWGCGMEVRDLRCDPSDEEQRLDEILGEELR